MGRSKGSSKTVEPETTSSFEDIEAVKLHEVAQSRYLNYALSVITSRALPDVRDGLKPVQRRIIYGRPEYRHCRSEGNQLLSPRGR